MFAAVVPRERLAAFGPVALAALVVVLGVSVAVRPALPFALVALGVMLALASMPPVPHLLLLISVTAIVPFAVQNRYGIPLAALLPFSQTDVQTTGGGSPGIILSDAILAAGLVRVVPSLLRRLDRRLAFVTLCVSAFLAVAAVQLVRSLVMGREPSAVGAEFRQLLGFSTVLLAIPIVTDPAQRRRLLHGLPWVGLAVGVWGVAQRLFEMGVAQTGDAGLREGVRFTTAGVGQIQGGLFAFPVALLLGFAALMSGRVKSAGARLLLVAVVILNGVSLLLTYERTFWVATVVGALFVFSRSSGHQRLRAVAWGVTVVTVSFVAFTTFAPQELTAARERFLSLSQYRSDSSVRFRVTESRHALAQIEERPLAGSGFAASIFWGRPWALVPPSSSRFIHNGYLWLAWRLGIPGALLLWIPLATALLWRWPRGEDELFHAVRTGCQAALLVLLVASVTFPSFSQLAITPAMGLLLAMCAARAPRAPAAQARPTATSRVAALPAP